MSAGIVPSAAAFLVAFAVTACGSEQTSDTSDTRDPTTRSTAEVGSCRGQVAEQEAAGVAIVEWIPLVFGLPTDVEVAFTARGIEDLGERDIYTGEDSDGVDVPRLARFIGTTVAVGHVDEPAEALVSPYQMADAMAEVDAGAELLVWQRQRGQDPPDASFASLAALEPDGDVIFLGDCVPGWTPAFARYVDANGHGLTAADLLTRILVDPDGPEAVAFRASDAAQTLAGPNGN